MDTPSLITIALTSSIVWHQARKNYSKGIAWTAFFLVWLPHSVRISLPDPIPELTVHRVILLVLVGIGITKGRFKSMSRTVPLYKPVAALLISYVCSMLMSIDFAISFKRLFFILFENFLFYITIVVGVNSASDVRRILMAALLGVIFIAVMAPWEYYKGLNMVGRFLPVLRDNQGVIATYQHSIHFGYVMAMAIPLALVFAGRCESKTKSLLYLSGGGFLLAGCYFSSSRGALLGGILSVSLVILFSGRELRKVACLLCLVLTIALVAKSGVRETVVTMIKSVIAPDGKRDASSEYRKILWKVAFTKISESPSRLLFGLGGGTTMLMDISDFFERGRGGDVSSDGYSSWDSQWASNLVQYGFLGLLIELTVWWKALARMTLALVFPPNGKRNTLILGAVIGCCVYLWAMLTVSMFSPQLKYLVSVFLACGLLLERHNHDETANWRVDQSPDETA